MARRTTLLPSVFSDRFIPSRQNMDIELSQYLLSLRKDEALEYKSTSSYQNILAGELLGGEFNVKKSSPLRSGIFAPKSTEPSFFNEIGHSVRYPFIPSDRGFKKDTTRSIPSKPYMILEASNFVDDSYLNLMDWSKRNILVVALGNSLYTYNVNTRKVKGLFRMRDQHSYISSVAWSEDGNIVAVGTSDHEILLWDVTKNKRLRSMKGHLGRVSSLSWNSHILSSGSRDSCIFNHDIRMAAHHISCFNNHDYEVCGLKWSQNGLHLASGGNDNILNIWELRSSTPVHSMTSHKGTVKALAWCPWKENLLASGGGTADRMIKLWNTSTGKCLKVVDSKSQVSSIQWSERCRELISSHGFHKNPIAIWNYPDMTRLTNLYEHKARILTTVMSPDGTSICSAGADERICFWKIFDTYKRDESLHHKPKNCSLEYFMNIKNIR